MVGHLVVAALNPSFCIYYDKASLPFLRGAKIDFIEDAGAGELTVEAPNAKNADAVELSQSIVGYWEPK